ncbi:MAG: LD-carboxypeptidase, partial [Ignavibacteriae bacterium]|nr:LD-carboxypeptidase [Ignavibacteriota bacterium]
MKTLKLIIYFMILFGLMSCSSIDSSFKNFESLQKIKPKRLKQGDTIGLVSPASYVTDAQLLESKTNLENLGFRVKYNERIKDKYGYLAGSDSARAEDLNSMFADKNIDAIMAVRGGYGCARMLDFIDYNLIKKNPKIIIGYSDITSLLYAIYSKTGLVCFHGPVGTSTFNDYSISNTKNILMDATPNYEMKNLYMDSDQIEIIK